MYGIFRNRLRDTGAGDYGATAQRMVELVAEIPGFTSVKTFAANDGERVSIFEFESLEALEAWKRHPEHQEAQRRGREEFYQDYELIVFGEPLRHTRFARDE